MAEKVISPREFGTAFKGFLDHSVAHAEPPVPPLRVRLQEHFGTDPAVLPVVTDQFEGYDQANVQLSIDDWLGTEGRTAELVGVRTHDLDMAGAVGEQVVVMQHDRVVESGRIEDVFGAPRHPYTQALLEAAG